MELAARVGVEACSHSPAVQEAAAVPACFPSQAGQEAVAALFQVPRELLAGQAVAAASCHTTAFLGKCSHICRAAVLCRQCWPYFSSILFGRRSFQQ